MGDMLLDADRLRRDQQMGRRIVEPFPVHIAISLRPRCKLPEARLVVTFDVDERPITSYQCRRALQHVELHSFNVDLDRLDLAVETDRIERHDLEDTFADEETLRTEDP